MNENLILNSCIDWIKEWFNNNGNDNTCAIVGISGGKDSTVTAGLLVKALGKDRVFGVLMPQGNQKDIDDAIRVCKFLDIKNKIINIGSICKRFYFKVLGNDEPNERVKTNAPARIRMNVLYSVAATYNDGNCRVANTSNLSEDILGYATIFGDSAGDFSPLSKLTSDEVVELGKLLEFPRELLYKKPSDGMTGKTDEDVLGFTYKEVNDLCRKGVIGDHFEKIMNLFRNNLFKTKLIQIPSYDPKLINFIRKDNFKDAEKVKNILKDGIGSVTINHHMNRGTLIHLTKDNINYTEKWIERYFTEVEDSSYKIVNIKNNRDSLRVSLMNDFLYGIDKTIYINDYIVINTCGLFVYPSLEDLKLEWEVY